MNQRVEFCGKERKFKRCPNKTLKDYQKTIEDIQDNINKRLKETAKKLKEGNRRTFSQVTGNFGNILSVNIYNEDYKREEINVKKIDENIGVFVLYGKMNLLKILKNFKNF